MITDAEIRTKGIQALIGALGEVQAGRFMTLALREPFDYTKWRQGLFEGETVEDLYRQMVELEKKKSSIDPIS